MPITYKEITDYTQSHSVANYAVLPAANTVPNELWYCINSQGTKWLPGSLGGTYYSNGWYFSDGLNWTWQETAFQASQADVDAGVITDQFVSPDTLNNYSKWTTKADISQTIANGVTTSAPSEDAVFNALDGKLNNPTGTPDGTKYLRDDNTWQPLPASGLTQEQVEGLI
jgi:hypothetical protein